MTLSSKTQNRLKNIGILFVLFMVNILLANMLILPILNMQIKNPNSIGWILSILVIFILGHHMVYEIKELKKNIEKEGKRSGFTEQLLIVGKAFLGLMLHYQKNILSGILWVIKFLGWVILITGVIYINYLLIF